MVIPQANVLFNGFRSDPLQAGQALSIQRKSNLQRQRDALETQMMEGEKDEIRDALRNYVKPDDCTDVQQTNRF